jgi:hypothetical protein
MLKIRITGPMEQLELIKRDTGQPWQRSYPNRGGDPCGRIYLELSDNLAVVKFLRALKAGTTI